MPILLAISINSGNDVSIFTVSSTIISPWDTNEAISAGGITNANFVINAVDAAGVQDVLTNQRGNIISMIREAAHDHGEEFIEAVDTNAYGDASTANTRTGKGGG